jgi:hypothetical protein
MKKLIIVIAVLAPCLFLKGQYSVAGVPGGFYTDISPDTLINCFPTVPEQYTFDINSDGMNDVKVISYHSYSPGTGTKDYVFVQGMNSSTSFALGSVDSTYHWTYGYYIVRTILKKFGLSDTIQTMNFIPTGSGYTSYYFNGQGTTAGSYQWINAGDKYIGVKYADATGVYYGWILVNCTSMVSCKVKEYSLGNPSITGIPAEVPENSITLYPNPSNGNFKIDVINIREPVTFQLSDITGRVLLERIFTESVEINMDYLDKGIYTALIRGNNINSTKSVVITD